MHIRLGSHLDEKKGKNEIQSESAEKQKQTSEMYRPIASSDWLPLFRQGTRPNVTSKSEALFQTVSSLYIE